MTSLKVLTRNPQRAVRLRTCRDDHRVKVPSQVGNRKISADVDITIEAELIALRDAVEDARDVLDLLMIGRHTTTHKPERRRQSIEHVDVHDDVLLLEQALGGVEAGGT